MSVHYPRRARPSGRALQSALTRAGYQGPNINFGLGVDTNALNRPYAVANATNKRQMRSLFQEHEMPIPRLLSINEALDYEFHDWYGRQVGSVVGRPDSHRQGRGFWLCNSAEDVVRAMDGTRRKAAATHFMEYIDADHEFRVHVVNGKSIKISEKIGGGNHRNGARFQYPEDFHHKKTVRRAAIKAVESLGLDFGAVDILWANDQPYVLEVNSAPCLTDSNSDTLERYVRAFKEEYDNSDSVAVHDGSDDTDTFDNSDIGSFLDDLSDRYDSDL